MKDGVAYLFPGQGAQFVGMGAALVASSEGARKVFDRGAGALGRDVLAVCLEGPEETLNSTRVSQPAIFLLSMAVLTALSERNESPEPFGRGLPAGAAAGLSLGEYSALVFAGSLTFEDALRIVAARGEFMQEACDQSDGAMASLIGLDVETVEAAVEQARSAGRIGVANYNSALQTVISGDARAVEVATAIARELGCRRAVPLRVAGAYHSPLMAPATRKLGAMLEKIRIEPPRCVFYSNVTGDRVDDPEAIRENLVRQIESPVRWSELFARVVGSGVREGIEVGPGTVLRGLARNIDRDFEVACVCDPESIDRLCVMN
jgi:[acyl-carrier-protein] S-malonyltransferase